ncbi:hypothetical protein [Spirillospora sp. CA-128828]|uniref:hypothetical protein n=1 Tax=Spirillospora sp. CA-128828 TaxID=3240033 RepID=UPI003D94407F
MTTDDRAVVTAEQEYVNAVRHSCGPDRHPDARGVSDMSEDELDAEVVKLVNGLRLATFHTRDSRRADGAGFPDRVIVGPGGVLWRELKREWSELRPGQVTWKYRLISTGQDWGLWRPTDLKSGRIRRELLALTHPVTVEEITRNLDEREGDMAFAAAMLDQAEDG